MPTLGAQLTLLWARAHRLCNLLFSQQCCKFMDAYSYRIGTTNSRTCESCSREKSVQPLLRIRRRYDFRGLSLARQAYTGRTPDYLPEPKMQGLWTLPSLAQKGIRAIVHLFKRTGPMTVYSPCASSAVRAGLFPSLPFFLFLISLTPCV